MATKKVAVKSKASVKAASGAKKKAAPAKIVKKAAPAAKKSVAKRKAAKVGSKLACMVCGYAVTVDQVCGCVEEHALVCCGTPMKPRKA